MQPELDRVLKAVERVAEAERELEAARKARGEAVAAARAAGLSLATIGKALGLSRQRVAQMMDG